MINFIDLLVKVLRIYRYYFEKKLITCYVFVVPNKQTFNCKLSESAIVYPRRSRLAECGPLATSRLPAHCSIP